MILSRSQGWLSAWWRRIVDRWSRTPGYVKWAAGLILGALVRIVLGRLFPERWESISHPIIDPKMPVWLAVVGLIVVLILERALPALYRRMRSRGQQTQLEPLFGVGWTTPPSVGRVQGPYCTACKVLLRGTLWSGDSSPTLWVCPSCGREFSTPEFPDIRREAERQLVREHTPSA